MIAAVRDPKVRRQTFQVLAGRIKTVFADKRQELVHRNQKSDGVNEAEQAKDNETGKLVVLSASKKFLEDFVILHQTILINRWGETPSSRGLQSPPGPLEESRPTAEG